ncbi:MAG: DUF4258 domain-containing protein [Oscillospiraceae bacterium]|nr:DUF4258 domain-containing protein [Oscillospiraceae bacterium]
MNILPDIETMRNLCHDKNIAITKHARIRLLERNINVEDIKNAIMTGEIIKQYENDKPFPSCLLLGLAMNNKHIHVVVGVDSDYMYIITAYYPDKDEWKEDLKERKE